MEGYGNHIVVSVCACVCVYVKTMNIGGATGRLQIQNKRQDLKSCTKCILHCNYFNQSDLLTYS